MPISSSRFHRWLVPPGLFILTVVALGHRLMECPVTGTEGHRIMPAIAMVQTGDWGMVRLFDYPYLRKPPLHIWLIAISQTIAGVGNHLVWRLPSLFTIAATIAVIGFFTSRWFGTFAGWAAGIFALLVVPLWSHGRTADVDASVELFAVVASCAMIEIFLAECEKRRWLWCAATAVLTGLGCLAKFPQNLPPLGAVILSIAFLPELRHRLLKPQPWVALVAGLGLTSIWVFWALSSLQADEAIDWSGLQEGTTLVSMSRIKESIVLPWILIAYGLPALCATIAMTRPHWRAGLTEREDLIRRVITIAATLTLCILIATCLSNPRYALADVLLLAPVSGLFARQAARGMGASRFSSIEWLQRFAVLGFLLVSLFFWLVSRNSFRQVDWIEPAALVAIGFVAMLAAMFSSNRTAVFASVLLGLIAVAWQFSLMDNSKKQIRMTEETGRAIGQLVPKDAPLFTHITAWSHPQVFLYADRTPRVFSDRPSWTGFIPRKPEDAPKISRESWILLNKEEMSDDGLYNLMPLLPPVIERHDFKVARQQMSLLKVSPGSAVGRPSTQQLSTR